MTDALEILRNGPFLATVPKPIPLKLNMALLRNLANRMERTEEIDPDEVQYLISRPIQVFRTL